MKKNKERKKLVIFKKNQVVTIAMLSLLITAGYLNYIYTSDNKSDVAVSAPANENYEKEENYEQEENYGEAKFVSSSKDTKLDYFNETKANKEKSRGEALSLVKEIAENRNTDEASKREAEKEIIKMAKDLEKEGNIENILMGKGFEKVSAYISDSGINVAVLTDGLKPEDVAKIRDVVISETKLSADKIKIMEIK